MGQILAAHQVNTMRVVKQTNENRQFFSRVYLRCIPQKKLIGAEGL
jgi:hypothetical protein